MKKKTSRTHRWKIQPDDSGVLVKVCYCGEVRQLTDSEVKLLEEAK